MVQPKRNVNVGNCAGVGHYDGYLRHGDIRQRNRDIAGAVIDYWQSASWLADLQVKDPDNRAQAAIDCQLYRQLTSSCGYLRYCETATADHRCSRCNIAIVRRPTTAYIHGDAGRRVKTIRVGMRNI